MTRILTSPKGRFGPYDLFGAARAVLALLKNVAQRVENRRAVMNLLEWDDRALKDIGITRTDVQLALGLPLSEDPSLRLTCWADERRLARASASSAYDDPANRPQFRLVSGRRPASVS